MRIRTPVFIENTKRYLLETKQIIIGEGVNYESIPKEIIDLLADVPINRIKENEVLKSDFLKKYHAWFLQSIQKLNWTFFINDDSKYPFFTSDNPVCSHLKNVNDNINIFEEFLFKDLRVSFPLSSKVCWVAHSSTDKPLACKIEDNCQISRDWWSSLNLQRAKGAHKYIYASNDDNRILQIGLENLKIQPFYVS